MFLPINATEVRERGWDEVDFVCVTGDAYVDHPSFGIAIISRLLEAIGFRVAILAQPHLENLDDFTQFGRPKLAFMITAGNIDSMVSNYTAAKKRRHGDAYSPKLDPDRRPDRAATVYARMAKKAYPDCPVILGGIEASLRRFAHYDYWADEVRPSILYESGADLLSYGMGEKQTYEIAMRLKAGEPIGSLTDIRGTCCMVTPDKIPEGAVSCASYEKVKADKMSYVRAFRQQLDEQDAVTGRPVVQKHGEQYHLQNAPKNLLTRDEQEAVFN